MAPSFCGSIKKNLLAAIAAGTSVSTHRGVCAVTLPIRTLDGRFVEVFVEQKIGDFLIVHDAGKTVGELHVQGIHWTEARKALLDTVAGRFGVTLTTRGVFELACKASQVNDAILAVSQCATVGMFEALQHAPVFAEEPISMPCSTTSAGRIRR